MIMFRQVATTSGSRRTISDLSKADRTVTLFCYVQVWQKALLPSEAEKVRLLFSHFPLRMGIFSVCPEFVL